VINNVNDALLISRTHYVR